MHYEINPPGHFHANFKELIRHKELIYFFTWKEIKVRYKQTALGILWALIQPIFLMIIFTYFLGRNFSIPSNDLPYPVFIFSGLLYWMLFSTGILSGANSMVSHAGVITKIYFPRAIIPISSLLAACFDFIFSFSVFILMMFIWNVDGLLNSLLYMPLALILTILASIGPALLLAALNLKFRDFKYVTPFLLQILFFVSPVLYPASTVKNEFMRMLLWINPVSAPVALFRSAFSNEIIYSGEIMISITSSVILLIAGFYYFKKTEVYFADMA